VKVGSVFSGIGGFDLGFEQAGLKSEWQVEIDKDCKRVLTRHWPNVERFDDVSAVNRLPRVDVLCGGFPCQDLSVAGKRAGLAGERSGLWFEFLRIAQINKPGTIVIENVPGLLSSDEHRDFAIILRGLVECGYCLAWRVLDAQFYGVAQRRRRVFIVGSLGKGSCAQILFESEGVSWNPPTRGEAGARIASAVTTGTGKSSGPRNGNGEPLNLIDVAATLDQRGRGPTDAVMMNLQVANRMTAFGEYVDDDTASSLKQRADHKDATDLIVTHALRSEGADAGEIAPTMRSQNFKDSHINGGGQVAIAFTERTRSGGRNFESSEELAYALTNPGSGGRPHSKSIAGGFGVRRLTPRECERLQSFPDDFTRWDAEGKEISDSARYRMLGNAVCVNVARWIGTRILTAR
jgi:DNA (cytosine-5)-methyltransferase 1